MSDNNQTYFGQPSQTAKKLFGKNPTQPGAKKYTKVKMKKRPVAQKPKAIRLNPVDSMTPLVYKYNDFIRQNKMPDQLIDVKDYANKNSPQFLDGDQFGINEEKKYVQNQLFRMQGDERYVPDYEDYDNMSDDEFEKYTSQFGLGNDFKTSGNKGMSDKQIENQVSQFIQNSGK